MNALSIKRLSGAVGLCLVALTADNALAGNFTQLDDFGIATNTGEKPQSKVWQHAGTWWACVATDAGATIWRLEGNGSWTDTGTISGNSTGRADCKRDGAVTHILLHDGDCELVSVQYNAGTDSYEPWVDRPGSTAIGTGGDSETASIDIDSTGKMWLATETVTDVVVYHSDPPYSSFTGPVVLHDDITFDDICAVAALPNNSVAVVWSDQNARRARCRIHQDGDAPDDWGSIENAADGAADDSNGMGMIDDHINLAVGSDSTLYVAIKSGYEDPGSIISGLLVRRPNGTWDDELYEVDSFAGTRPIVIVNEAAAGGGILKVIYKQDDALGDNPFIAYRDSSLANINFGAEQTALDNPPDGYNNPASTKDRWTSDVVLLASDDADNGIAVSVLFTADVGGATGACCLADGSCEVTTEGACAGEYQGDDTSCGAVDCPQPVEVGACCFKGGVCQVLDEEACPAAGGAFQGGNTDCTTTNCPLPPGVGACCLYEGECEHLLEGECDALFGVYQGEQVNCSSVSCPVPSPCPSDVNDDLFIDVQDLLAVILAWGTADPAADINNDGTVDVQDLLAVVLAEQGLCITDCNGNFIEDADDIAEGTSQDCNGNGIPDECDIADATSQDCNANGLPDECEAPDCNDNGIADDCEVDCNNNGVPDDCDIANGTSQDCNGNLVPDECDIADGTSQDCNGNGIADECEPDCNLNGVQDDCDIADGTSEDCNTNGIPDECDPDVDGDGIPDDCQAADNCEDAGIICPGDVIFGDTSNATSEVALFCNSQFGMIDVWLSYTPADDGVAIISVCDFDCLISVYDGCAEKLEDPIICNADGNCGIVLPVQEGVDYRIRIAGHGQSTGQFTLELAGPNCE